MFNQTITSTAFTTRAAENFFANRVYGESFNGDTSVVSTVRALMSNRLPQGEYIGIYFNEASFSTEYITQRGEKDVAKYIFNNYAYSKAITFCILNNQYDKDANDLAFDAIKNKADELDSGYVRIPAITDYFRRNFDVLCYVSEKNKHSLFILKNESAKIIHQLQTAIITALPWYFNAARGDKLTPKERELLESLQEKTSDHYIRCLNEMAAELDFERMFIVEKLRNIETMGEKRQIENLVRIVNDSMRRVTSFQEEIDSLIRTINENNILISALTAKFEANSGESPLCDYFLSNRALHLDNVEGSGMVYRVRAYLSIFDEGAAQEMIDDRRSLLYRERGKLSPDEVAMLAKALFIDESVKLRMWAAYYLDTEGSLRAKERYRGNDWSDMIANPHIQGFACLGDYRREIERFMLKRDYVMAINQTIASAQSVNLRDYVVMARFFPELFGNVGNRWFELPDGNQATLPEVIAYLRKEKEEKENE